MRRFACYFDENFGFGETLKDAYLELCDTTNPEPSVEDCEFFSSVSVGYEETLNIWEMPSE